MYKRFFPFGQTSPYTEYVWALFDADGDGRVGFEEFILAVSVATRGELKERLDCRCAVCVGVCVWARGPGRAWSLPARRA